MIEGYPVYAVHQDAMAPMALLAVEDAGGPDFAGPVERGLEWLRSAPELGGGSLVDDAAGLIWRKVARREPGKLARSLQALGERGSPEAARPRRSTRCSRRAPSTTRTARTTWAGCSTPGPGSAARRGAAAAR